MKLLFYMENKTKYYEIMFNQSNYVPLLSIHYYVDSIAEKNCGRANRTFIFKINNIFFKRNGR